MSANLVAIPAAMRKVPRALYKLPSKVERFEPVAVRTRGFEPVTTVFPAVIESLSTWPPPARTSSLLYDFRSGFISTDADSSLTPPPCPPHATTLNLSGTFRPFPTPAAKAAAAISLVGVTNALALWTSSSSSSCVAPPHTRHS